MRLPHKVGGDRVETACLDRGQNVRQPLIFELLRVLVITWFPSPRQCWRPRRDQARRRLGKSREPDASYARSCLPQSAHGISLYKGFLLIRDFPLQGISLYKGFPFISDFPIHGISSFCGPPKRARRKPRIAAFLSLNLPSLQYPYPCSRACVHAHTTRAQSCAITATLALS